MFFIAGISGVHNIRRHYPRHDKQTGDQKAGQTDTAYGEDFLDAGHIGITLQNRAEYQMKSLGA